MKKIMAFILISILILTACGNGELTNNKNNIESKELEMTAETKIVDIIENPLFEGFGQFLFPIDTYRYDDGLTLNEVNLLLPYHSHIQNETSLEVLNYMQNEIKNNHTFFYNIYSKEEKEADPSKENTGLFFFRGKQNAPFAIVNAGGGFSYVGSIHESFPHALEISKQGYNAFALQYRTGGADVACEDLAAAIAFIYEHADELEVDVNDYSLWGGSAGARMAAYLGSYGTENFGQKAYPKPSTVVMQYTGHSDYTASDPATYVCVGKDDGIANWQVMKQRIELLDSLGIDTEFHLYEDLGHGFGLGIGTSAEGWINDAVRFWEKHIEERDD